MKLKRLNNRGVAHHFALALVIVGIITAFAFQAVAGHAETAYSNPYSCPSHPELSTAHPSESPTCTKYIQTVVGISATGSYDARTKVAVQKFQFDNHVSGSSCGSSFSTCDGITGARTWAALVAVNKAKLTAAQNAQAAAQKAKADAAAKAAAAAAAAKPTGSLSCTTPTDTSITVNATYAKATSSKVVELYQGAGPKAVLVATYPAGSGTVPTTVSNLKAHKLYLFQLRTGKAVIASKICRTKAHSAPTTTPAPKPASCLEGFKLNPDNTCTTTPTTTKPTCPAGTTLATFVGQTTQYYCEYSLPKVQSDITIKDGNQVFFKGVFIGPTGTAIFTKAQFDALTAAQKQAVYGGPYTISASANAYPEAANGRIYDTAGKFTLKFPASSTNKTPTTPAPKTTDPIIACTYYAGTNEVKVTKQLHTSLCNNVHKQQAGFTNCTFKDGTKTVTAMHSVTWCNNIHKKQAAPATTSTNKPTTSTSTSTSSSTPKPAKPVTYSASDCHSRPRLRQGSTGDCVAFVQSKVGVSQTGTYSSTTVSHVATYQTSKQLVADGTVGPCTWKALRGETIGESCKDPNRTVNCIYEDSREVPRHVTTTKADCDKRQKAASNSGTVGTHDAVSPTPVTLGPTSYASGSLVAKNCDSLKGCHRGHNYSVCAKGVALNSKEKAIITFGPLFIKVDAGRDKTLTSLNKVIADGRYHCLSFSDDTNRLQKWEVMSNSIHANSNAGIVSAYLKDNDKGTTWQYSLSSQR